MTSPARSSRIRFDDYRLALRNRGSNSGQSGKPGEGHEPASDAPKPRSRGVATLLRRFLGMLGPHTGAIALALGTLTVATVLGLAPPAATKLAIDCVFSGAPLPEPLARWFNDPPTGSRLLALIAISVAVVSLMQTSLHLWGRWHATRVTKRLQVTIRRDVFDHAVRLPLHRIHQLKSGGVASLLREDAGAVAELVFGMLYNPWRAIIQLSGSLAVLAFTDWRLLLGSLVLLPSVWISHRTWINRIRPIFRDIPNTRQDIDGHATEAFGGMRVVRGFGRERSEAGRFVRGSDYMARQELLVWWWSRILEVAWALLIPIASAGLLYYGGSRVLDGAITPGDLVMFLAYLVMLLGPIEALAASATQLQTSLAALDKVLDLLDEPQDMPRPDHVHRVSPTTTAGRITIRDLSFTYPGGSTPVLRHIAFDASPGETIALVGPSGSGKTTLCNLIARFHDPTEGSIMLDGVDLRRIDLDDFRRLLGIVEQDVFLFDGSIAENIAYANRHASTQAIHAAAEAANAAQFIDALPQGYATNIGERGVRLSGGQRQRIAIARALLADPRLLILDEATSNLDSESELLIQQSLSHLVKGRTTFVIAHRLSTIRHADRIIVLENGRLIEMGSHDELMALSGRYRGMVLLQLRGEDQVVMAQG